MGFIPALVSYTRKVNLIEIKYFAFLIVNFSFTVSKIVRSKYFVLWINNFNCFTKNRNFSSKLVGNQFCKYFNFKLSCALSVQIPKIVWIIVILYELVAVLRIILNIIQQLCNLEKMCNLIIESVKLIIDFIFVTNCKLFCF